MNPAMRPTASPQIHALTDKDAAFMERLRLATAPNKGTLRGIGARPAFDAIARHISKPAGVTFRRDRIGGIDGWWCEPEGARPDVAILHLHGGWFSWGTAEAYCHLVGHIAQAAGARAFIPDYRLAPEHPFPAAPEDARACLNGMAELSLSSLAVTGDSAGGNLALGLAAYNHPVRPPIAAIVAISPVTDLTLSGQSWSSRADEDPFFLREQVEGLVAAYLAGHPADDPLASPLLGELTGLPPVQIHVGDAEMLRDDSLRYGDYGAEAGADVRVHVWDGVPHGFIGNAGSLDAADTALTLIGTFLSDHLVGGGR